MLMDVKHFEHKNGVLVPRHSPDSWERLRCLPLRSDDVFITVYPRSGTTWMSQIVKLLRTGGNGDGYTLWDTVPWLDGVESGISDVEFTMQSISQISSNRIFKCHLPYELVPGGAPHTTPAKYICVLRNPKDVFVSLWYHNNMTNLHKSQEVPWEEHFKAMMAGNVPYGSWFNHVLGWWAHKDASNILFIKYEDMKSDLLASVHSIAKFIGIENITDTLLQTVVEKASFSSMKKDNTCNVSWAMGEGKLFVKDAEFIRKGVVGDWRNHFTEEQSKRVDEMLAKRMSVDLQFE